MADYTVANIRESEDLAAKQGFGDVQEARFLLGDLDAEATGLSHQVLKPGKRGFAHHHKQAEEIYVVLAGHGRVKLDDEVRDIGPLDAVRVSPSVARAFEASDDGLELLAFGPRTPDDAVLIREEFWEG